MTADSPTEPPSAGKNHKHLLLVYHSKTGNTQQLAEAAQRGINHPDIDNVRLRVRRAKDAGPDDLLWANGLLLGTPENFGYMSGALKDFLDRTYYEVEGKLQPLPYALFVSCENDGRGAVSSISRIAGGYPLIQVQEPVIARGAITEEHLHRCEELGLALAMGLDAGIY